MPFSSKNVSEANGYKYNDLATLKYIYQAILHSELQYNIISSNKDRSVLVIYLDHQDITVDPQLAMILLWTPIYNKWIPI